MFRNPFSSPTSKLSLEGILELANKYMENAREDSDPKKALRLTNNANSLMKDAEKTYIAKKVKDPTLSDSIANSYHELGKLFDKLGHHDKAQISHGKAEKWGYICVVSQYDDTLQPAEINRSAHQLLSLPADVQDATHIKANNDVSVPKEGVEQISRSYFGQNIAPPVAEYTLPDIGGRFNKTTQLVYCLSLLNPSLVSKEQLDKNEFDWVQARVDDPDEKSRLQTITTDLIRAFVRDELKSPVVVAEVVSLAPVLDQEDFVKLLQVFVNRIDRSILLKTHLLDGLAQLIRNAPQGYIDGDDLVRILNLLNTRLKDTHEQSTKHIYRLAQAISRVLDSMVDSQVEGLSRELLHEPLSDYLKGLQKSSDPYLVHQAAYAYQALLYVPNDESILQSMMRRTGKVAQGISGVVSAVKALNVIDFIEGLQSIQDGLVGIENVIQLVSDTYEDTKKLTDSGEELLESLKEGFKFTHKSSWYPALRGLDSLLREGRFVEFEILIRQAPCWHNPTFQWGVCQRLGEISSNPLWVLNTRKSAVAFLVDLYNDDDLRWGCQPYIKQWILSILNQLAQSTQDVITDDTRRLLQELQANGSHNRVASCQGGEKDHTTPYPTMLIPPSKESPLLDRVQNKADVETPLSQLKRERLKDRGGDVYISPRAKVNLRAKDDFDLTSKVEEFLESEKKVFLILGDSGSGKSTFNRALEINLWDKYNADGRIPLFVSLPTIEKPERDLIAERLRQANFTENQIRELRHREFILICDGYDEIQGTQNLYITNQLNKPGGWQVQMLISCRTEYNGSEYVDCFQPTERNNGGDTELFQEARIMPFNNDQIQEYIDQYVSLRKPIWRSEDYLKAFKQIPNLQDLVKNPFLLKLALEVLPRLLKTDSRFSTARITRLNLYDEFVAQWIERGKMRLREMDLSSHDKEALSQMTQFKEHGIMYLKELVIAIYENQNGKPIIKYSVHRDRKTWKEEFFNDRDGRNLLREAIPLTRNDYEYQFIHKSVLEYGLALAVYDPNDRNDDTEPRSALSRRGSTSSIMSFEQLQAENTATTTTTENALLKSPLGKRDLVHEQSVLQFLAERVKQQPVFKDQLYSIVEQSKTDKLVRMASANAITILVRAGVQFHGADLRNIKIPGADLSFGVFDSAQLEGADLRRTNLRNIWMEHANLRGAQMTGVRFGELPLLREDNRVLCCTFSPDGKMFAVGLAYGNISLYETSSWDRVRTWRGHTFTKSLSFSGSSNQIASGGDDKAVRLWDIHTGDCIHTLLGHTGGVNSVVYSPKAAWIASGSNDEAVRLWDGDTGECIFTLQGHADCVMSVVFSPRGDQIASGSDDKTVRLWNVNIGNCVCTLQGHTDAVNDVVYSPKGDRLVSGGWDKTVRLWDVETGECLHTLRGHTELVHSVAFSPKGDQIASGSKDKTVQLWDIESGECLNTFQDHKEDVKSVVYSPNGNWIASGSWDKTVRLRDVGACDYVYTFQGHSKGVRSIALSPGGDQIASGSSDKTIRLWDIDSGDCACTLRGHTGSVGCVTYSPKGDRIASGGEDKTARLWDVETGECLSIFKGHSYGIQSVIYSLKGDWIASAGKDETIRLWDVETGNSPRTLQGHTEGINGIAISPKGYQIASGSDDSTVRLWDIGTTDCRHTLLDHSDWIRSIAYSPKGDRIASGSDDHTVQLWDADKGNCIHIFEGHTDWVLTVAFSPSGDQIASGSHDKTVRLWGVDTRQCLLIISGFDVSVTSIAWENSGNYLVTGSLDGLVRRWRLMTEYDEYKATLSWSSPQNALTVRDVSFSDAQGLSRLDRELLIQRGASNSNTPVPE